MAFGIFESALSSEQEVGLARQAAVDQREAAIYDVRAQLGPSLFAARDVQEFRDRVAMMKNDQSIYRVIGAHIHPSTGVVRSIVGKNSVLEKEFRAKQEALRSAGLLRGGGPGIGAGAGGELNDDGYGDFGGMEQFPSNGPHGGTGMELAPAGGGAGVGGHSDHIHSGRRRHADQASDLEAGDYGSLTNYKAENPFDLPNAVDNAIGSDSTNSFNPPQVPTAPGQPSPTPPTPGAWTQAEEGMPGVSSGTMPNAPTGISGGGGGGMTPGAGVGGGGGSSPADARGGYRDLLEQQGPSNPKGAPSIFGPAAGKTSRRRRADFDGVVDTNSTFSPSDGPLEPSGSTPASDASVNDFNSYVNSVDQDSDKVGDRNFISARTAWTVYADWCQANGTHPGKLASLDAYSANLSDGQYFRLAQLIHAWEFNHQPKTPGGQGASKLKDVTAGSRRQGYGGPDPSEISTGLGPDPTQAEITGPGELPLSPDFSKPGQLQASRALQAYTAWCRHHGLKRISARNVAYFAGNDPELCYHLAARMRNAIRVARRRQASEDENGQLSLDILDNDGTPELVQFAPFTGSRRRQARPGSRRRTAAPDYLQKADDALTQLLNQKATEFQETIAPLQQALVTVQQAEQLAQQANPLNVLPAPGTVNVMPGSEDAGPAGLPAPGAEDLGGAAAALAGMGGGGDMGGGAPPGADMGGGAPPPGAEMGGPPGGEPPPEQQMMASRRRQARSVLDLWGEYTKKGPTLRGGPSDYEDFARQFGVGDKALNKLKQHHQQGTTVGSRLGFRKGAPFAGYDDFDDCTSQNSDKRSPDAYCGEIKHKVEGGRHDLDYEEHGGNLPYTHSLQALEEGGPVSDEAKGRFFRNRPSEIRRNKKGQRRLAVEPAIGPYQDPGPASNWLDQNYGAQSELGGHSMPNHAIVGGAQPEAVWGPVNDSSKPNPANWGPHDPQDFLGENYSGPKAMTGRQHHARLRYLSWCRRHRLRAASTKNFYWYAGQVHPREAALLTADGNKHDYNKQNKDQIFAPAKGFGWEPRSGPSGPPYTRDQSEGPHRHEARRKRAYGDDYDQFQAEYPAGTSDDFNSPAAGHEYHDPYQQNGWKMTHADDDGHAAWSHPSGHSIVGTDGPDGGAWQLYHPSGQRMGKPFKDPAHAQEAVRRHLSGTRRGGHRKVAWSGWGPAQFPKTRQVTGWDWNNHLNGYVANRPQRFACECGDSFGTPSGFHRCACGKQWNSYVIGTGGSKHEAAAEKFLVREIPVRDDVIVANRQLANMHDITNPGGIGEGRDAGTSTMKRDPKDWANRMPPTGNRGQWSGSPIGA